MPLRTTDKIEFKVDCLTKLPIGYKSAELSICGTNGYLGIINTNLLICWDKRLWMIKTNLFICWDKDEFNYLYMAMIKINILCAGTNGCAGMIKMHLFLRNSTRLAILAGKFAVASHEMVHSFWLQFQQFLMFQCE